MNFFEYRNNRLFCEGVPVQEIAEAVGTPVYIYSYRTFERHFRVFNEAFRRVPHLTCYSCKANSNIALLRIVGSLGGGIDIVSGGELYRARRAGVPGERIVFSGVGKREDEIRQAVTAKVLMINVESEQELAMISRVARDMGRRVPLSVRVNPQIDAKTHPYITTGLKKNKFGVLWKDARKLYGAMKEDPCLVPIGISSHIGSQILELSPFQEAVRSLKAMIGELTGMGLDIRYLDVGGGLGIAYKDELPPHPREYARLLEKELKGLDITLVLEPGRVLVGNSGILVTRLLYVKKTGRKAFYIVDGAMNDLVRPAFYDAYHDIRPVDAPGKGGRTTADVVGPICESGDFFAKERDLPEMEPGALLALFGAGAYGFSMASNYNSRCRAAEVLVKGGEYWTIRKRETLNDLVRGETIPSFLEV